MSGVWWRHVPTGSDPLSRSAEPADNRWQRGSVVDAVCLASDPTTAWAEWYRYLAEAGVPPGRAVPRDLWRWRISLPNVADLSDEARLETVGLPSPRPTRHQWPTFQTVGERLHAEGWAALLSPSAARPEGMALCVFRTEREVPGTEPMPPPETVNEPPVVPTGLRT